MQFVQPIRKQSTIRKMKEALKSRNLRDYALFSLGINCGLRISDLLSLTVKDVLAGRGKRIRIRISKELEIKEHKTRKVKRFPINDKAREALREYLVERRPEHLDEPLFLSRQKDDEGNKAAISRFQVWRAMNHAARAAGIPESYRIGTHTLRKTFGYQLRKSGVDIPEIQMMLNHSHPAVTIRYLGITDDKLATLYRNLNL